MLLIVIFILGCSSSEKEKEDRRRTEEAQRSSEQAEREAQRSGLPMCEAEGKICAKGGKKCKNKGRATYPSECEVPPSLVCACPANTDCVLIFQGSQNIWICYKN